MSIPSDDYDFIIEELEGVLTETRAERDRYRKALQNTYEALKDPAFVRCTRCGWQESTSDLDVMSLYIKPALGIKE